MSKGFGILTIGAVAAAFALSVTPVLASHGPDDDETKCETNASKRAGKFARAKIKCINKCEKELRGGDVTRDCKDVAFPGDGDVRDPVTQACITDAENKFLDAYDKKCTPPDCVDCCPECYSGGDCAADGDVKKDDTEAAVDLNDGLLAHCGPAANDDEFDCQQATASILAKFAYDLSNCTAKCEKDNHKNGGRDCNPDGGLDAEADACADAKQLKCEEKITSKCSDPAACQGATPSGFCATVRTVVDGLYDDYFCASPSGAFLE